MKLTLVQDQFLAGDIHNNTKKIIKIAQENSQSDLIIFPEQALYGYPALDLLYSKNLLSDLQQALQLIQQSIQTTVVIGLPHFVQCDLYNSLLIVNHQSIRFEYSKKHLADHEVFNESRYFQASNQALKVFEINHTKILFAICEDIWHEDFHNEMKKILGVDLIIVINASPYSIDKHKQRIFLAIQLAKKNNSNLIYVNRYGFQDEILFDGGSFILNNQGKIEYQASFFQAVHLTAEFENKQFKINEMKEYYPYKTQSHFNVGLSSQDYENKIPFQFIYHSLVLGLREYFNYTQLKKIVLGLSGGIDSALSLAIAVDAVGNDKVVTIMLNTEYTSDLSFEIARNISKNFKVELIEMEIQSTFEKMLSVFETTISEPLNDITQQNFQARIRGNYLMAYSNQHTALLLTTGNRSELAVGYGTLYGDMCGGFNCIKNLYKTEVFKACQYRNQLAGYDIIPLAVIERKPTAELKNNQLDEDDLPNYDVLDKILYLYLEQYQSINFIQNILGIDEKQISKIISKVDNNEYKRLQSCLGTHIRNSGFGVDRKFPVMQNHRIR